MSHLHCMCASAVFGLRCSCILAAVVSSAWPRLEWSVYCGLNYGFLNSSCACHVRIMCGWIWAALQFHSGCILAAFVLGSRWRRSMCGHCAGQCAVDVRVDVQSMCGSRCGRCAAAFCLHLGCILVAFWLASQPYTNSRRLEQR